MEVRTSYYSDKEEYMREEELPPLYTQAPGSICPIPLVVVHKGVEVIVIRVGSPISAVSI